MDVDIIETDTCGNSNLLKSLGIQIPDSLSKVANYDPLGPKLLIHQIENENFKSYYGKQILGPFHKNYTAIIGPNGSGKSNVIDSMLFVFGFRAAKIRSKKVSVLIHNSSKHSNLNSCTVKVFFRKIVEISMKNHHKQVTKDNQHNGERILATPEEPDKDEEGDHDPFNTSTTASSQLKKSTPTYQESIDTGFSVVPGSEFVISRTAFKDNSSYYCIDGKKTNFKEMSDFLKSHGIDLDHNRFLILQGEVEMISLMKPKATNENEEGMLEFLEDIIGSNRFKPALSTMKQVLETENEKRASMLNRFKSTEKELKALEAPLEGAIQYLSLENEIIKNRNALLQINEYEANKAMVQKETKFKEAEQTLKDLSESLAGNEDAKKDIDVQYKSKYKEFETATNSLGENKKKLTELEMADAKIRENYKHLNAKNQGLVKSVEIERNKVIKHQSTIANNREYLSNHEAKLESLKISKCSQESALQIATEALKENTKELRLKKEKKEKRLVEDVENKYIQAKSSLDKAKGELKIYTEHVEGNLNKAKNLQKKIGEIETCKSDIKTKLNELTQDILPRYESQADTLKKKIEDVKNEERGVEHQLKEGRDKMKLAQDNLTALTNSLTNADCGSGDSNAQQGNPFRNRVLRALKESESNGELDGIYGRLGDLGRVDPIYDVALSSACGSTLDNILVRDEDTARDCINILKRLKLPPTTFICLNKMRYNANTDRIKDKNQRLFDKITTVNEKFESAFFYATRETLLARDINEATRLADSSSRRQRVVTMGGEVVEISGTLTGGGSRPMSGKMASKFLVEYNSANDKINYLHQKNSNKSIQDTRAELEELARKQASFEQDIQNLEKMCQDLLTESTSFRQQRTELEDQLKNITSEGLTQAKFNKAKWTMDLDGFEMQLQTLNLQLAACLEQGAKDGTKSPRNDTNLLKIEELNVEIADLQAVHDNRLVDSRVLKEEIEKINAQIKAITDNTVTVIQNKLSQVNADLDKLNMEANKLSLENQTLSKNISKMEIKISNEDKEIAKNGENIKECKVRMKEMEQEATLVLQNIDSDTETVNSLKSVLGACKKRLDEAENIENDLKSRLLTVKHEFKAHKETLEKCQTELARVRTERAKLKLNSLKIYHGLRRLGGKDGGVERGKNDSVEETEETGDDELTIYEARQIENMDAENVRRDIKSAQAELVKMKQPDLSVLQEYGGKEKQFKTQADELEAITTYKNSLQELRTKLKNDRLNQFLSGFTFITVKLKEIYRMITLGGDADLELIDSLDPFTEGVSFKVRPLNKSWKNVTNLSGGEKTLSSVALIFALHHYKPTPFYVMDEIDAALDFKNVSIVANYVKQRTQSAQFIIISLRHNMFELSDRLIGIYKTFDCTKNVVIQTKNLISDVQQQK